MHSDRRVYEKLQLGRGVYCIMKKTTRRNRIHKYANRAANLVLSTTTALSALFLAVPTMPGAYAAQASQVVQAANEAYLQLVKEEIVTSGAVLRTYKWAPSAEKQAQSTDLRVLVIDLHNPYVQLNVMSGRGGKVNSKQTVLGMARETNAVAGVNASFFHMNAVLGNPLGAQIVDQELTVSPLFLKGWYSFGVTTDRKPVIGEYDFDGTVMTASGATYELRGINKPLMWDEDLNQSHTDSIFMYTSVWGPHPRAERSHFPPTEVLVVDGIVTQMSIDEMLDVEIPENGYLLRGEGKGAEFLQEHVNIGEPIHTFYQMRDRHTGAPVDPTQFKMLIGGQTLLVDQGRATAYTTDVKNNSGYSPAARTAVGYSADGRYVYLLTADRSSTSRGMTLKELQEAMIQVGVWRGINLDGGGSTTMVARELGDTTASLVNKPSQGSMRQVVNGIGVYTTAPQGQIIGLIMDQMPFLFVGEHVELPVRGYDEYYNPVTKIDLTSPEYEFSVTEGYGRFEQGRFIPSQKGKATITVKKGAAEAKTDVVIVDRTDIDRLVIEVPDAAIRNGSMLELTVKSKLKDGRSREVPADAIEWKIEGFRGSVSDGVLTVEEVAEDATARLIATYDGLSTAILLPTLARDMWADFDTTMPPISVDLIDPLAIVSYEVTNEVAGEAADSNVLKWRYDFSQIGQIYGSELPKIAIEFNRGAGVEVQGNPQELVLDVYGDGKSSRLWLEATDTKGTLHTIPIGTIDWTGWRTVEIDLSSRKIPYPLTLQRLVQESPENPLPNIDLSMISLEELMAMVDPEVVRGELAIDNIIFQAVHMPADPENKRVELQVNNTKMLVDGEERTLDQPPVIIDRYTMVPIRFIVEALDGDVSYDPQTNKVTLVRGRQYVEMWIGEQEMNFNGRKVTAPIAPTALNNRTLVPVRVLSEYLGWDVYWDNDTQSVTLIGRN